MPLKATAFETDGIRIAVGTKEHFIDCLEELFIRKKLGLMNRGKQGRSNLGLKTRPLVGNTSNKIYPHHKQQSTS